MTTDLERAACAALKELFGGTAIPEYYSPEDQDLAGRVTRAVLSAALTDPSEEMVSGVALGEYTEQDARDALRWLKQALLGEEFT